MMEAAGYVLIIGPDRQIAYHDALRRNERFAEAVPEFSHSRRAPLVVFLSLRQGYITHVARGKRGWTSGSVLRRLNCTDITEAREPLAYRDLLELVPRRLQRFVRDALNNGGLVGAKSFWALANAARTSDPELGAMVDRIAEVRPAFLDRLTQAQETALVLEKEATVSALKFAGLSTASLAAWQPPQPTADGVPSFLAGLSEARLREDAMVLHDLQHVPGWERIASLEYGAVVFSDGHTQLTVIHANKQPLEEFFGADLIYYNETYRSFVMVQYKVFDDKESGDEFRLPSKQLNEELDRMDAILDRLRNATCASTGKAYRFVQNPFFLKFCNRVSFELQNTQLIKGRYLPFDYWKLFEQEEALVGARGGRFVTPASIERYLGKDVFISLVEHAWIGTSPEQSAILEPLVAEILRSGRPLTVAIKTDVAPDTPGETGPHGGRVF
jgi:hypothetical protein